MVITTPALRYISRCFINPDPAPRHQNQIIHLASWDIAMLSTHHIQNGLLYHKPPRFDPPLIDRLKASLACTLSFFYPSAGRLITQKIAESDHHLVVYIDCTNGTGAEFIHAEARDLAVSDVLDPADVPDVVKSFFPYAHAINHDGHSLPLLSIQFTELKDGVFIGCNFNHVVGDGASFWNFFNAWDQMARTGEICHDKVPIIDRVFLDSKRPPLSLPFSDLNPHLHRRVPPPLRERIFHFSAETIKRLKREANADQQGIIKASNIDTTSSFQSLCALVWQSVTRARPHLRADQKTSCRLAVDNRSRLDPALSPDYFGNCIQVLSATTTVVELLSNGLGSAARLIHASVAGHTDGAVRETATRWVEAPYIYSLSMFDACSVMVGSSPRFDMYGCEFGCGKAVAVRGGYANKYDGKVSAYPGREGGGSVDLEVCLAPESMALLEKDADFMKAVMASDL